MSRAALPSRTAVLAALAELRQETETTGRPPASLSLARRLGLANTTFRRHFPDVAADLTATTAATGIIPIRSTGIDQLKLQLSTLRTQNRDLRDHLELAIANIQRLTIENDRLRRQTEAAAQIRHIPRSPLA